MLELCVYSWTSAGPSYPQLGGLLGLLSSFRAVTWADEIMYVKAFVNCKAHTAECQLLLLLHKSHSRETLLPFSTPPPSPLGWTAQETLRLDSPSHMGGSPCLVPPLPPVMAFPVLPGFRGLTPEGSLLSSSESSGVAEIICSFGVSSGPPPSPLPSQCPLEPGCPGRI